MSKRSVIRILIIDENREVCEVMARTLKAVPGIDVIAHTTNPVLAVELAHQFSPQVIVADFKHNGFYRAEALRWMAQVSPESRLVVHTSYYRAGEREAFEQAGADRCLLKGTSVKELGAELLKVAGNFDRTSPRPKEDRMAKNRHFSRPEALAISENLGIDWTKVKFDIDQFERGLEVELEHGTRDPATNVTNDDPVTTGKIALAHLNEFPDYYVGWQRWRQTRKRAALHKD